MADFILGSNLKYLRNKKGVSQSMLGSCVGKSHTSVGNWETGYNEPSLFDLVEIARYFGVTVDDLLTIDLSKGKLIEKGKNEEKGNLKGKEKGNLKGENDPKTLRSSTVFSTENYGILKEADVNYGTKTPKVITLDAAGNDNIVYVPVQARAGYLLGYGDPKFIEKLDTFHLPGLRNGTYRMFEIDGVSMAPTLLHGDRVICRWVENFDNIRENHAHIVVSKDGVVAKRVFNRIEQRGKLALKSDTISHRKDYPTYDVNPADVYEIWYPIFRITADMSEPAEIYTRLNNLEADFVELRSLIPEIKAKLGEKKK